MRSVVDWLALDFAVLVQARPEQTGETQTLAIHHRFAPAADTPDPVQQASVKQVLGGKEIVQLADAWKNLTDDAFVRERRFECLIGLPLMDERRVCLGALVVGRRDALTGNAAVLDGLRVIAHRLALDLELRRVRDQGRARGLQDALTGLPNRLLFNDRLESTIQEAHRTGEMFAVVFVDLDRFKNINDSLGHAVGDQVLIAVSKRLRASVRASDTVARYAGDEFTMILRHIVQRDDVMRIADKVVRVMEAPLTLAGGLELHITASLGLSFYPDDATNAERLLKHADVAMYTAKGMGRNNYQAYVAVPEESHQQRLALEAKLRQAEKNGELRVHYQPQVDARSEDIVGMEALIRWEHPELGMISPGFFIPLAEESGLIVPIGEWVLRAACADARRWQTKFHLPLRISVNLSPLQLRQPGLVQLVAAVVEETGLDPHLLDLEVTEIDQRQVDPEPARNAAGAARSRLPDLDRRFRHRPVLARLHQAVPGRPHQDRPGVRAQHRRRSRRRGDRAGDDLDGAQPQPRGRRRGRRNRGAPRIPARAGLRGAAGLSVLPAAAGGELREPAGGTRAPVQESHVRRPALDAGRYEDTQCR